MKICPGYVLRQVIDIYVVLGIGSDNYVPNEIMSVNETGAFLWHILEEGAEKKDLIHRLTVEYGINKDTAAADVEIFLTQLREKAMIIE